MADEMDEGEAEFLLNQLFEVFLQRQSPSDRVHLLGLLGREMCFDCGRLLSKDERCWCTAVDQLP